jgi:hypothetical protein
MWPQVVARLEPLGIDAKLDTSAFRMEVTTTARTWDPYAILKARELVRLVARGMSATAAAKVLEDGFDCGTHTPSHISPHIPRVIPCAFREIVRLVARLRCAALALGWPRKCTRFSRADIARRNAGSF